jgi:stage III sporulation protein AB
MRLLGAVLLAGGTALLGVTGAHRTQWRVRDLRMLTDGLRMMLRELSYRLAPLPELLCSAEEESEGSVKYFFALCVQGANELDGRTFHSIWRQSMQDSRMCLASEEWHCLDSLGAVLGRYDSDNQIQALNIAISRLDELRVQAEEQCKRLGKLYSVLGLTAGAFLMILLV